MSTGGGEKPAENIIPLKRDGVLCDTCHVEMEWFHTRLERGELGMRTHNAFMCPNCHGVSTRVSVLKP